MGFDVSNVPTADVMELAAKLLEYDAAAFTKLHAVAGAKAPQNDHTLAIAALLRERVAEVRAMEGLIARGDEA